MIQINDDGLHQIVENELGQIRQQVAYCDFTPVDSSEVYINADAIAGRLRAENDLNKGEVL